MNLRDILVIAYYFPPMGMSGVQRTMKFVKYLPQFGWRPTVLTVAPTGYFAQDETMLEELAGRDVEIVRVGSLDPNWLFRKKGTVKMPSETIRKMFQMVSDSFFVPDNKILWRKKAMLKAEELFAKKNFEVIFATAPPWTDFLIGMELRYKYNVPLVVDYRDSWLHNPFKYYPTPLHTYLNFRLEKKVLRSASRIITTNRKVKELILKKHLTMQYNDITILSQGFDPEDFPTNTQARNDGKMKITHAGAFYGKRTPSVFLHALQKLCSHSPQMRERIAVEFIGKERDDEKKLVEKLQLQNIVSFSGYLNHRECVARLCASDILFIAMDNDVQSPGKLYEYFGTQKPILASIPDGYLKQTIENSGVGICVTPKSVDEMTKAIATLYQKFERRELPQASDEFVQQFDREKLTGELSKIFGFLIFD
ncbi:MAG: glycosyltransferase family 4 protein [Bacteroidota bacterium]